MTRRPNKRYRYQVSTYRTRTPDNTNRDLESIRWLFSDVDPIWVMGLVILNNRVIGRAVDLIVTKEFNEL